MGNSTSSAASSGSSGSSGGNPPSEPAPRKPSYYSMIKNSYGALVNAIIRPPRSLYDPSKLGPVQFNFCGRSFKRTDFNLVNPREMRFCCSLWEPIESDRPSASLPCVIYMHGNSSSRLEALASLSLVLGLGATLLAFDFSGSGHSDGQYVSLGAFEKDDLQCVIEYLRASGSTSTIALWGRSMGAATALLHGERDPSIAAMVLDSAFSNLVTLAEEMVEMGRKQGLFAPNFIVRMAIQFIRSSVQKTAGFDITTLAPIESADKCFIPALFIAAEDDNFVSKTHSEAIHGRYGGDKNLVIVEGDHNSPRPRFLYDSIGIFLTQTLQLLPEWSLPDAHMYVRRLPWSYNPLTAPSGLMGFSAHVTSVGSRHSGDGAGRGESAWTSVRSRPASGDGTGAGAAGAAAGGAVDGGRGEEISFDELLALSIALNEEEAGDLVMEGQPGIGVDPYGLGYEDAYGAGYEFDDATDAAAAEDFAAERAMQAGVQHSLMRFMNDALGQNSNSNSVGQQSAGVVAGAGDGAKGASSQATLAVAPANPSRDDSPPPVPAQDAPLPPKLPQAVSSGGSPASGSLSRKGVLVNPITGRAHAMSTPDSGTGAGASSDSNSNSNSSSSRGSSERALDPTAEWQCGVCGGSNVTTCSAHTCVSCGWAR